MTILYIDDDEDDVDVFRDAITAIRPQSKLFFATDGQKGLELLAKISPPDFIFLDMNMPAMTGREVLIAIRKENKWRNSQVVILSTVIKQRDIVDYKAAGANACIVKPVSFAEFCNALAAILPMEAN